MLVQRLQFEQGLVAVLELAVVGRVKEREVLRAAEVQRLHLQDDAGEVGPQHLRVGELRPAVEVALRVEPHRDALGDAAAAAAALVGRRLADRLDGQPLHLAAGRIPTDPGQAGVDDVADARHRQRRLGDVGGQHDPPLLRRLEHPHLLLAGEPGVERQDLGVPQIGLAERFGDFADVAFSGEKHQRVGVAATRSLPANGPYGIDDGGGEVGLFVLVERRIVRIDQRLIPHLDRVGAAADLDDRGVNTLVFEVLAEPLDVDGRRRDDELQVRAAGQQIFQVAEEKVDVQAAFVGLVDDDRVVVAEEAVALGFGEQDAVGHQLDHRVGAGFVGEADLVADDAAELRAEFVGNAAGDGSGGEAAGLGVADLPGDAAAQIEANLWELRRLAAAGFAGDDDDLVIADGLGNVLPLGGDGQFFGIIDARPQLRPPLDLGGRVDHAAHRPLVGLAVLAAGVAQAAQQPVPVPQHAAVGEVDELLQILGQRGLMIRRTPRRPRP